MRRRIFRDQRGLVLLFVVGLLGAMLGIGGLAVDAARIVAAETELRRILDAAALAGAGNLGFDSTAFPTAVTAAQTYAGLNSPFSGGSVSLAPGDVVLGIYDGVGRTFTPSNNGTFVNAVQCTITRAIPTAFLALLGRPSVTMTVRATAVSNPPAGIPNDATMFPIGAATCAFQTGGSFGSQGCGGPISLSPGGAMAWMNTQGPGTPSASQTRAAISAAFSDTGGGSTLTVGSTVGTQNGTDAGVFNDIGNCNGQGRNCTGDFVSKFNATATYTTRDANHNITYQGHGWEVYVALLDIPCPPPNSINGDYRILTFARVVITQVINQGWCAVANHYPGNAWDSQCPAPNGTAATRDSNKRMVFGYFECVSFDANQVGGPAPRAALATRMRLVN
jgi:hypothetical protein